MLILFAVGEREALLSRLSKLISSSSAKLGVHFEMASFVEESIMEDLLNYVIPHVCISLFKTLDPLHVDFNEMKLIVLFICYICLFYRQILWG